MCKMIDVDMDIDMDIDGGYRYLRSVDRNGCYHRRDTSRRKSQIDVQIRYKLDCEKM